MNALSPNLLDTDFKQLAALARSLLPQYAPAWTDHNLHDPGIMLVELLAWITEAQIYSLARVRTDQRWAFGELLGIAARGAQPATGMAWPKIDAAGAPARGALVAAGASIDTGLPQVPVFRLRHAINLTAAAMRGVETWLQDGSVLTHTAANARRDGGFQPFGAAAGPHDQLVLSFDGPLLADATGREAYLAIGVRAGPGYPVPHCAGIRATLIDGSVRYPLPLHADGSMGFSRSGVLLLSLRHVPSDPGARFQIAFQGDGFIAAPRITCLEPNVLPMEQTGSALETLRSNGAPDQAVALAAAGILFPLRAPTVRVQVLGEAAEAWRPCADLALAGPADPVFHFDPDRARIRFGNGVNGCIPPRDAAVTVDYEVTGGDAGNLPPGRSWTLHGGTGQAYTNPERTAGGTPPLDLDQLRRQARMQVRQTHPIVTDGDLEQAALQLGATRAHSVEAAPAADTALPADRVLVVLRERQGDGPATENTRWLELVREVLAPRLLLGERLRVNGPDYVALRVEATLATSPGYDTASIERSVRNMLAQYFKLIDAAGGAVWPLGRAVRVLDLKGRLLGIDGVATVAACALFRDGQTRSEPVLSLKPAGLPLFQPERSKFVFNPGETL